MTLHLQYRQESGQFQEERRSALPPVRHRLGDVLQSVSGSHSIDSDPGGGYNTSVFVAPSSANFEIV